MVFVDGKAIALSTNHTLNWNSSLLDERTKDDGDKTAASEFDYASFTLTTDSIVGDNPEVTNEQTAEKLIDLMLAMTQVQLVFDATSQATGTVPAGGWAAASDASYPTMSGSAYITSLSISAGASGSATMSITFSGYKGA